MRVRWCVGHGEGVFKIGGIGVMGLVGALKGLERGRIVCTLLPDGKHGGNTVGDCLHIFLGAASACQLRSHFLKVDKAIVDVLGG